MPNMREPLTVAADPAVVRAPRRVLQAFGRGLLLAMLAALGMGAGLVLLWLVFPAIATGSVVAWVLAIGALIGFANGAYRSWNQREADIGATVASDGIMMRREGHSAFYHWTEITSVDVRDTDLVLGLVGGYAYRVSFRTRARVEEVVARAQHEEARYARRNGPARRPEPRDVPQPGDALRWVERQRARFGGEYRRGTQSFDDAARELGDPDLWLHERLGAAIALASARAPQTEGAIAQAIADTASDPLRAALTAIANGTADDAQLGQWVMAMLPRDADRTVQPIGVEPIAHAPLRIEAPPDDGEAEAQREAEAVEEVTTGRIPRSPMP